MKFHPTVALLIPLVFAGYFSSSNSDRFLPDDTIR